MLDFVGITIIILFFIRGYMKGIIVAIFSVLAVILGIMVALKLSGWLAQWLLEKGLVTSGWGQLISYAILFVGVLLLVRLISKAIETSLNVVALGWVNRVVGGMLFACLAAIVWSSLLWIMNQMGLLSPEAQAASHTYVYLEPLAPWAFNGIGKLLPFAKDIFHDLQQFFDKIEPVKK